MKDRNRTLNVNWIGILLALVMIWNVGQANEPERVVCSVWTEEVTAVPARSWYQSRVAAHRKALREPPQALADERDAKIIEFERTKVKVESSNSKVGSYSRYRARSTFTVTFQKIPCAG